MYIGPIRYGLAGPKVDVDRGRRETSDSNLNLVYASFQIQVLEDTVKIVHDTDVVTIDVDSCIAWCPNDAHATVRGSARVIWWIACAIAGIHVTTTRTPVRIGTMPICVCVIVGVAVRQKEAASVRDKH